MFSLSRRECFIHICISHKEKLQYLFCCVLGLSAFIAFVGLYFAALYLFAFVCVRLESVFSVISHKCQQDFPNEIRINLVICLVMTVRVMCGKIGRNANTHTHARTMKHTKTYTNIRMQTQKSNLF